MLNWKPHTQTPSKTTTALIASNMSDDMQPEYYLVGGLYVWHSGQWIDELSGEPLETDMPYYWLDEADLMATIKPVSH